MARTFAQIKITIWKDDDFRGLTMAEQWLYKALFSQPDLTAAGVLIYRPKRWAKLCADTDEATIEALVASLIEKRYLIPDWESEEILVRTFVKHDGSGGNWKFRKGVQTAIDKIESDALRTIAQATFDGLPDLPARKPKADGSPTDEGSIGDRLAIDEGSKGNGSGIEGRSDADRSPIGREPDNRQPENVNLQTKPSTFNLEPSSSSEVKLTLAGGTAVDDDRFQQALDLVVEAKAAKNPPTDPNAWYPTVRANTLTELGPTIRDMVDRGRSPFEVASELVGKIYTRQASRKAAS